MNSIRKKEQKKFLWVWVQVGLKIHGNNKNAIIYNKSQMLPCTLQVCKGKKIHNVPIPKTIQTQKLYVQTWLGGGFICF